MKRIALLLLVSLAGCTTARTAAAPAPSPEAAAVVAVADRLFDAMRTRDTVAIKRLFTPQARIVAVGRQNGVAMMRERAVGEFLGSIATAPEALLERMWDAEVRIDGDLATLWAPYDFHRGAQFSHCGVDAFQLVRVEGAWRIVSLSYTLQPEGCPPAPPR
ncbi:nuclear transport factor 2 family protein [Longimicrobium sp.]|uniref:nuclear transport factor 2 family protein n=1 Tax=Longimicrobium sp. TaxID=2029185 RepID=UPI002E2FCB41|nr:nuclear transport factor 2 family protein [Longimicrobium sp.]HEX6037378.1 nuclear transport factor 2 family protein [Longimicrobium sp.]